MPYLGIFDQKCFISVFLGKTFRKTIYIFEISTLKFVYLQNFAKKQKCPNFGRKMLDLGIFRLELESNIITFEISTLEFVYLPNFAKKRKCLNLGPKMPYLGVFGLELKIKTIAIFEISILEFV